MDLNSLFSGLGTQMVMLIVGALFGAAGSAVYFIHKNKQNQKSGDNSKQFQASGNSRIVYNSSDAKSELDIRNFSTYTNEQIEGVIKNGNNATRRKWCLEMIAQKRADYLILDCISKMDNSREKYNLLVSLLGRQYENTDYFKLILESLTNNIDKCNIIKLLAKENKPEHIKGTFESITSDRYAYEGLLAIYEHDKDLFAALYKNGNAFDDKVYKRKMRQWLARQ